MHDTTTSKQQNNASTLEEKVVFFFVCMGIMAITYGILFIVDFLPEKPTSEVIENKVEEKIVQEAMTTSTAAIDPLPLVIIFDSLGGKEVSILNPESNTVTALDTALLSGVVRHPNSADFKNTGTIFLLGHSSYLPVVHNKNFQAFNGIQKLVWGDTIRLRSKDTEYVYAVDRVYQTKAAAAEVAIEKGTAKLTLSTCNSFATKDDRFIVESTLIDSHSI